MENHMPHGITQYYLPPGSGDFPAFTLDKALFSNHVDLTVEDNRAFKQHITVNGTNKLHE